MHVNALIDTSHCLLLLYEKSLELCFCAPQNEDSSSDLSESDLRWVDEVSSFFSSLDMIKDQARFTRSYKLIC